MDPTQKNEAIAAAAAPSFFSVKPEAVRALGFFLSEPLAETWADKDPELALLAARWIKTRTADTSMPKVLSPAGLLMTILRTPEACGFCRKEGAWQPPPLEGAALRAAQAAAGRLEKTKLTQAQKQTDQAGPSAHEILAQRQWAAMDAAQRAEIKAEALAANLIPRDVLDLPTFAEFGCIAYLRRQIAAQEGGK